MTIYDLVPEAIVSREEMQAPFDDYADEAIERFGLMGVMDESGDINETALRVLAATFAANFAERCYEFFDDDYDGGEVMYLALRRMWRSKEITGMYLYLVLCCSIMQYEIPREILWISRHAGCLAAYMEHFMEAMKTYFIEEMQDLG